MSDARMLEGIGGYLLESGAYRAVEGVAAGGGTTYSDTFDRANATGVGALGAGWSSEANWNIDRFAAYHPTGMPNDFSIFLTDLGSDDHWVEGNFLQCYGFLALLARRTVLTGTANIHYFGAYRGFDGRFVIGRMASNGATTEIVTEANNTHPNFTGRVRLEVQGTALRLYAADSLVLSTTDSTITTGHYTGISADNWPQYIDDYRCGVFPYVAASSIFSDDFNRADSTGVGGGGAGLGPKWGPDGGYYISSNAARRSGGGDYVTFRPANVGTPDMWVEVQVAPAGSFGVINCRRPQGNDNGTGYLGFWDPAGFYKIGKSVGGSYADVVSGTSAAGVSSVKLRLETQGTAIRLYANDVLVASATDSSITTGNYAGMNCTEGPIFDNFRCGPLPYTP